MSRPIKEESTLDTERMHICCEHKSDAIIAGHIECFERAGGDRVWWPTQIAAIQGHLDMLKYLYETRGYEIGFDTLCNAVIGGHITCVKYLLKCGCPWRKFPSRHSNEITEVAAAHGRASCLRYFLEQGISLGVTTVGQAVKCGNVSCLRVCLEHDPVAIRKAFGYAVIYQSLNCLQYLLTDAHPSDETEFSGYHERVRSSNSYAVLDLVYRLDPRLMCKDSRLSAGRIRRCLGMHLPDALVSVTLSYA